LLKLASKADFQTGNFIVGTPCFDFETQHFDFKPAIAAIGTQKLGF
jgi:hypothetical protein